MPVPDTVPRTLPVVTTTAISMFTVEETEAQGARSLPEAPALITEVARVRLQLQGLTPEAVHGASPAERWLPCHAWGLGGEAGRWDHSYERMEEGGQDAEERCGGMEPGVQGPLESRKVVGFCDPAL